MGRLNLTAWKVQSWAQTRSLPTGSSLRIVLDAFWVANVGGRGSLPQKYVISHCQQLRSSNLRIAQSKEGCFWLKEDLGE